MAVSVRGLYFVVTLFLGSFFGSVFMLGPVLPLMLLSPAWYRWITDRIVATWLTLPVVCTLAKPVLSLLLCVPDGLNLPVFDTVAKNCVISDLFLPPF